MVETSASPPVSGGVRALYWLHVLYLALLPGAACWFIGPDLKQPGTFWAWIAFGFVGIPVYALWVGLLMRFPDHLAGALVRTFGVPLCVGWWWFRTDDLTPLVPRLFLIEWGSILVGWLALSLVPARWQLPEAYLGGKRPEGLTGYLAQVSLGGLVVGGLLVDLYYVFKPDIEGLVGIDLLFFATVIAVDAAFLCHSMWRGHVKDENVAEVGVTLLLGFSFWCLAMMSAPTG